MIVGSAEAIASRPSEDTIDLIESRFEDYEIRYGYVVLDDGDVERLARCDDAVAAMLCQKVAGMRAEGESPPYIIELMISS
jgi:hypothetical protein